MEISTEFNLLSKITNARSLTGEDALTNKIAIELKALTLEGKLKGVWFHVPNESVVGNFRDVIRIKRKHDMGLINGVADFVIVTQSKTIFVELKTEKGRQSDFQKLFQKWCEKNDIKYFIIRNVVEFKSVLMREGLIF